MKNTLILKMWRYKLPALTALATMAAAFLWPALFLGGITNIRLARSGFDRSNRL